MMNKIRRLRWKIKDHIDDSKIHMGYYYEEKEEGDNRAAALEVEEGLRRLSEAKKGLDKMAEIIKDHESKDKSAGMEDMVIKEKYCGWRAIHEMLSYDVKYLEEKFNAIKM